MGSYTTRANRNGRSPTRDRPAVFTHVSDDIGNELVVRDVLQLRDRYSFGFFEQRVVRPARIGRAQLAGQPIVLGHQQILNGRGILDVFDGPAEIRPTVYVTITRVCAGHGSGAFQQQTSGGRVSTRDGPNEFCGSSSRVRAGKRRRRTPGTRPRNRSRRSA